jgi:AcrR family transcriptional regulator
VWVTTTRLTRAEQVERNRERLVAAAREVFAEAGYAKATLDAISERAGFSKGVVYSQFESKADLFLVLLERRIDDRAAQNRTVADRVEPHDALAALVDLGDRDARDDHSWSRVLIEFRAHASYDPALNARYAALHARTVEHLAETLDRICRRAGVEPTVIARTMAEFLLAVANGTKLERTASSDALPTNDLIALVTRALGLDRRTP